MPKNRDFSQNCFERKYLSKTFPQNFLQVAKISLNKEKKSFLSLGYWLLRIFKLVIDKFYLVKCCFAITLVWCALLSTF